jgi:hypothetical protein
MTWRATRRPRCCPHSMPHHRRPPDPEDMSVRRHFFRKTCPADGWWRHGAYHDDAAPKRTDAGQGTICTRRASRAMPPRQAPRGDSDWRKPRRDGTRCRGVSRPAASRSALSAERKVKRACVERTVTTGTRGDGQRTLSIASRALVSCCLLSAGSLSFPRVPCNSIKSP